MRHFIPAMGGALAALVPVLAVAQTPSNDGPPLVLPTVTVERSGGREQWREDLQPNSARNPFRTPESSSNHVQIIGREEIEQRRPRDIFELLNGASGVMSTQGSRKGFSGLRIRGDSNFRWILDGALLQPTMASRIINALPVMMIEEVKIVRGGSALTLGPLVGSASPGGAPVDGFVVVRTRKPNKDEAQLRLAAGTLQTAQAQAWGGKVWQSDGVKGYVAGMAAYGNTEGPDERLNNGADYNAGRESTGGMAKGGFEASGWTVDFMAYRDQGSFEIPNANSHGQGQGSWYMSPSRTEIYTATGSKAWSSEHTTLFSLSHTESKQRFWTANTAAGPYSSVQNDNETTHINLRHNIDWGRTRAVIGGDYLYWDAPNGQQYYEGIRREEETKSWFGQIEHSLFDNRLTLDAGYRRDQVYVLHGLDYYTGGAQPYGGVNSPLRTVDRKLTPAHFFSEGASFKLDEDWKLTGRLSQARQAADSLNATPGTVLGDDEQRKWEIGIEGKVTPWFRPSLNFFHRDVVNEKTLNGYTYVANNGTTQTCRTGTIPSSGTTAPRSSSSLTPCYSQADTTREGIELTVSGNFAERSNYRVGWTYFTGLSSSAASITPRHMLDISVTHGIGDVTIGAAVKHVSSFKSSTSDAAAYLGDYTRFDLDIGYDFELSNLPMRATLFGRNLTDVRYETTNGVQDVGRFIGVELLVTF